MHNLEKIRRNSGKILFGRILKIWKNTENNRILKIKERNILTQFLLKNPEKYSTLGKILHTNLDKKSEKCSKKTGKNTPQKPVTGSKSLFLTMLPL